MVHATSLLYNSLKIWLYPDSAVKTAINPGIGDSRQNNRPSELLDLELPRCESELVQLTYNTSRRQGMESPCPPAYFRRPSKAPHARTAHARTAGSSTSCAHELFYATIYIVDLVGVSKKFWIASTR